MKKAILLPGYVAVMLCSCLHENTDHCPAMRNLLFSYYCEYDPDESFDNRIANDVFLCTYQDNKLKNMEYIPYEKIRGGKAYSYQKRYGGNIHFAAWAVHGGSPSRVPQYDYDEDFYEEFLEARPKTRATLYYPFNDGIYLGTESLTGDDITVETTHKIRMINTACQVLVTVNDANNVLNDPSKELYVLVEGVMSRMNLLYRGVGDEAEVYAAFSKESGSYTTGYFGVLPSADAQSVNVRLYYGDDCVATVKTGEQAVSGGRIIVNFSLGTGSVYVDVNGFEIIPSEIKWM